jgi:hypothetical protein
MKTKTTDTPRTDAEQFYPDGRLAKPWVEVSFARKLERELSDLKEEVRLARKEWVGDDFDYLPLSEALGKVREMMDKRADESDEENMMLRIKLNNLVKSGKGLASYFRAHCKNTAGLEAWDSAVSSIA